MGDNVSKPMVVGGGSGDLGDASSRAQIRCPESHSPKQQLSTENITENCSNSEEAGLERAHLGKSIRKISESILQPRSPVVGSKRIRKQHTVCFKSDLPDVGPIVRRQTERSFGQTVKHALHHSFLAHHRDADFSDLYHFRASSEGVTLSKDQQHVLSQAFTEDSEQALTQSIWTLNYIVKHEAATMKVISNHLDQNATLDENDDVFKDWLKDHAEKLANVIDMAIASVATLEDSLGSFITAIGTSHADYIGRAVGSNTWDLIAVALVKSASATWNIKHHKSDTLQAWRVVAFFIVDKIRQGYVKQLKLLSIEGS